MFTPTEIIESKDHELGHIGIEILNGKGTTESGRLESDNGDGTYQATVFYPFGDCKATVRKTEQWWDVFEFVR